MATREDDAGREALLKKLALWTGLALCIAFIAWVAWGFLEFDHDVENPAKAASPVGNATPATTAAPEDGPPSVGRIQPPQRRALT